MASYLWCSQAANSQRSSKWCSPFKHSSRAVMHHGPLYVEMHLYHDHVVHNTVVCWICAICDHCWNCKILSMTRKTTFANFHLTFSLLQVDHTHLERWPGSKWFKLSKNERESVLYHPEFILRALSPNFKIWLEACWRQQINLNPKSSETTLRVGYAQCYFSNFCNHTEINKWHGIINCSHISEKHLCTGILMTLVKGNRHFIARQIMKQPQGC